MNSLGNNYIEAQSSDQFDYNNIIYYNCKIIKDLDSIKIGETFHAITIAFDISKNKIWITCYKTQEDFESDINSIFITRELL